MTSKDYTYSVDPEDILIRPDQATGRLLLSRLTERRGHHFLHYADPIRANTYLDLKLASDRLASLGLSILDTLGKRATDTLLLPINRRSHTEPSHWEPIPNAFVFLDYDQRSRIRRKSRLMLGKKWPLVRLEAYPPKQSTWNGVRQEKRASPVVRLRNGNSRGLPTLIWTNSEPKRHRAMSDMAGEVFDSSVAATRSMLRNPEFIIVAAERTVFFYRTYSPLILFRDAIAKHPVGCGLDLRWGERRLNDMRYLFAAYQATVEALWRSSLPRLSFATEACVVPVRADRA